MWFLSLCGKSVIILQTVDIWKPIFMTLLCQKCYFCMQEVVMTNFATWKWELDL